MRIRKERRLLPVAEARGLRTEYPMSDQPTPSKAHAARPARERLDVLVAARGLAPSRERAQALIMAGQVRVNKRLADKPGLRVAVDADITLAGQAPELRYVSRGGLKLEAALNAFGLDVAGRVVLDIGASTGGFTDVCLRRGAARVYAIDVGQGQLAWGLRSDPRVVVMERTNIRTVAALPDDTRGDAAVIDVSFISLRQVLPAAVALRAPGAWIVALVKPQFEAGTRAADRGQGVMRDRSVHQRVRAGLVAWAATSLPYVAPRGLMASPITGRDGNREFLLWLATDGAPAAGIDIDAALDTMPDS